jgi:pimeloyl-ACP methyl ester carboxylesterase
MSRLVDTNRLRVHVMEVGEGHPVVCLHGWPQDGRAWRRVAARLADRHRVICPDLRGFGRSETPREDYSTAALVDDVLSLLDALELERVHLLGHELGGRVAFHLCLRAPERVGRLVTLNALHPFWSRRHLAPQAWRSWWTVPVETPLLGRLVLRRAPAFLRLLFRLGGLPPGAADAALERLSDPARARAAERVMTMFAYREILPTLLHRPAMRLTVPTLMLNGTRDFALSPRELAGHEPYADELRIELVHGGGHFLAEQHPERVAAAARAWFEAARSVPPRSAARSS